MKKKDRISTRGSGSSRDFAEKRLQHTTTAAEVTQDRNQKAESIEKDCRKEFWAREIKHDGFRLMVHPAALSGLIATLRTNPHQSTVSHRAEHHAASGPSRSPGPKFVRAGVRRSRSAMGWSSQDGRKQTDGKRWLPGCH